MLSTILDLGFMFDMVFNPISKKSINVCSKMLQADARHIIEAQNVIVSMEWLGKNVC